MYYLSNYLSVGMCFAYSIFLIWYLFINLIVYFVFHFNITYFNFVFF